MIVSLYLYASVMKERSQSKDEKHYSTNQSDYKEGTRREGDRARGRKGMEEDKGRRDGVQGRGKEEWRRGEGIKKERGREKGREEGDVKHHSLLTKYYCTQAAMLLKPRQLRT